MKSFFWKKEAEDKALELFEFQESSRDLERMLEQDLARAEARIKELEASNRKIQMEQETMQEKLKAMSMETSSSISSLQLELQNTTQRKLDAEKALREHEQQNDSLQMKERELAASVADLSDQLERTIERMVLIQSELEEQKARDTEAVQRLRDQVRDLENELEVSERTSVGHRHMLLDSVSSFGDLGSFVNKTLCSACGGPTSLILDAVKTGESKDFASDQILSPSTISRNTEDSNAKEEAEDMQISEPSSNIGVVSMQDSGAAQVHMDSSTRTFTTHEFLSKRSSVVPILPLPKAPSDASLGLPTSRDTSGRASPASAADPRNPPPPPKTPRSATGINSLKHPRTSLGHSLGHVHNTLMRPTASSQAKSQLSQPVQGTVQPNQPVQGKGSAKLQKPLTSSKRPMVTQHTFQAPSSAPSDEQAPDESDETVIMSLEIIAGLRESLKVIRQRVATCSRVLLKPEQSEET